MDDLNYRQYALVRIKDKPLIFKLDGRWRVLMRDHHQSWWDVPLKEVFPDFHGRLTS